MKYPGKIPDKAMEDWFSDAASKAGFVPHMPGSGHANPCVAFYGPGPAGEKCKHCQLLFPHHTGKTYYKCKLRGFTHGPGTDHRVNWPACARFIRNT